MKINLKQTEGVTGVESITSLPATIIVDGYKVKIDIEGNAIVEGEDDNNTSGGTTGEDTPNPPESNIVKLGEIVTENKIKYIQN